MKDEITEYKAAEFSDDDTESQSSFPDNEKIDTNKIDSRRKLEDYLEQKRLEKELYDY